MSITSKDTALQCSDKKVYLAGNQCVFSLPQSASTRVPSPSVIGSSSSSTSSSDASDATASKEVEALQPVDSFCVKFGLLSKQAKQGQKRKRIKDDTLIFLLTQLADSDNDNHVDSDTDTDIDDNNCISNNFNCSSEDEWEDEWEDAVMAVVGNESSNK